MYMYMYMYKYIYIYVYIRVYMYLFELQEVVEGLHAALVLLGHGVPLDQELYIYIYNI